MCFAGGVPVPEVVLKLRVKEREPRVARAVRRDSRIDADTEQVFADIGEFRCAIFSARADRDPALGRANDEARNWIRGSLRLGHASQGRDAERMRRRQVAGVLAG